MGDSPVFLYLRRGMRARSVTVHVGTFGGRLKALRTFVAASLITSLPLILQSGGASAAGVAIRIDTGSAAAYTDSAARIWQADRSFVGGATTANAIRTGPTGTTDPALFKTMRYGKDFSYAIPVATAGTYLLRLHTAELNFSTPGSRRFTISAEGKPVTEDLDLAKAPGIRTPWTLEVPVTVTDGTLNLRFLAALDYAQIAGIEILRTGAAPAPSTTTGPSDEVTRIDAGSTAAYTDSAGRTWQADRSFVGGATTANAIRTGPTR